MDAMPIYPIWTIPDPPDEGLFMNLSAFTLLCLSATHTLNLRPLDIILAAGATRFIWYTWARWRIRVLRNVLLETLEKTISERNDLCDECKEERIRALRERRSELVRALEEVQEDAEWEDEEEDEDDQE